MVEVEGDTSDDYRFEVCSFEPWRSGLDESLGVSVEFLGDFLADDLSFDL